MVINSLIKGIIVSAIVVMMIFGHIFAATPPPGRTSTTEQTTPKVEECILLGNCACFPGHYCPVGTEGVEIPCPSGTFLNSSNGVDESDCLACSPGLYCEGVGLSTPTGPCSLGYYCTLRASTSMPTDGLTGNLCPAGYYCPLGSSSPTACLAGTYLSTGGASSSNECILCDPGYFCDSTGLTSPSGLCDAGYYCVSGASTGRPTDTQTGDICMPGFYCPEGSTSPVSCPPGQYMNASGASSCWTCPAGFYCPLSTVQPTPCPMGHYCLEGAEVGEQFPCPIGTFNNQTGGVNESDCELCTPGYYCNDTGLSVPTGQCADGFYCILGASDIYPSDGITGDQCPAGHYCPKGAGYPIPCPDGTYMSHEMAWICFPCLPGFYCVDGAINPTICPQGFYCPEGTGMDLQPCPNGTFGQWPGLSNSSECTIFVDCGPPEAIPNGQVAYDTTYTNSRANYTCNPGYYMIGDNHTRCHIEGYWNDSVPQCLPYDCGLPGGLRDGFYTLLGDTTYGSIALYSCIYGYHISRGDNKLLCSADQTWIGDLGTCVLTVCTDPRAPENGNVTFEPPVVYNTKAVFTCNEGFFLLGWNSLTCLPPGTWNQPFPQCERVKETMQERFCPQNTDGQGTTWKQTIAGTTVRIDCPGQLIGNVSRNCTHGGVWRLPKYSCIKKEVSETVVKIDAVLDSNTTSEVKSLVVSDALDILVNSTTVPFTESNTNREVLYDGEIELVTSTLGKIVEISEDIVVTVEQSKNFLETTSNLLRPQNSEAFESLQENFAVEKENSSPPRGANKILKVVEDYAGTVANSVQSLSNETERLIKTENLEMTVSQISVDDDGMIQFPENSVNSKTKLHIGTESYRGATGYSGVLYYNLSGLMPSVLKQGSEMVTSHKINTPVLAFQLFNTPDIFHENFSVSMTFKHFDKNYVEPTCAFWNHSRSLWDTNGCSVMPGKSTSSLTECRCTHLTNFAVLMNPFRTENVDSLALSVVTIVGCTFSAVCLAITIVIYVVFWRLLRSDRAVLLVNLSVALLVSYIIFMAGVEQTDSETGCTITAVLLHYVYLVVFTLMLSEGIEILITVVYVFPMKSRLKWLLAVSWGCPVLVVAISMGATQLDGYGSQDNCWLSVEGGLIWAFVGPALTIILNCCLHILRQSRPSHMEKFSFSYNVFCIIRVNFVQLILIMQKMFTVKSVKERTKLRKLQTGVRCLCVLLPLIGCTWVIGVFYVNEDLAWIQYVFAVLNGLQGFVIMLFHCVLNNQVQLAFTQRWRQYKSSALYTRQSTSSYSSSTRSGSLDKSADDTPADTFPSIRL